MANSIITVLGDGVTTQYPLNFTLGILSRDYVTCRVGSEVDGLGAPVYRTLEWVTDGLVNIQGAVPGNNVPIVFKRTVPKYELQHDYSYGVPITEENLDESNLQTMMAIHEFLDGRLESGFVQDLNMNGSKITDLGAGSDPNDAVNFAQLQSYTGGAPAWAAQAQAYAQEASDHLAGAVTAETNAETAQAASEAARDAAQAAANGMRWRPSVRFATNANDSLTGLAARNGITPVAGDRVLVGSQTTTSANGIYVAAAGAWTRATDADAWSKLVGLVTITEEASTISGQTDVAYICTVNTGGTLGTTPVTFVPMPSFILDGAVSSTAKIADGVVTYAKLASASISTAADILAGTASRVASAAAVRAALLGVGQVWTNVTGTRALATDYINSTGKPIMIMVQFNITAAATNLRLYVGGVEAAQAYTASWPTSSAPCLQAIVPPGATYRAEATSGTAILNLWTELR